MSTFFSPPIRQLPVGFRLVYSSTSLLQPGKVILRCPPSSSPLVITTADPQCLQGKQLQVYNIVLEHVTVNPTPLRMMVSGTAGLIHCLRLLLADKVHVAAPTGVATFNIEGPHPAHSPGPPHLRTWKESVSTEDRKCCHTCSLMRCR